MSDAIVFANAFTDVPFAGNPAAVCLLDETRPDAWLQALARETNLSATAFLRHDGGAYHLRWFAPAAELTLCGHGTLATAHVLWEGGFADADASLRFTTQAGLLTCTHEDGWIAMDFPAEPALTVDDPPAGLIEALGILPRTIARNRLDYLVEVDSEADVREAHPDLAALKPVPTRGVIVTARADANDVDFVSRFFAPAVGIDEDSATGSAHCALGPFWGDRLEKVELVGRQLSPRGGVVRVRLRGDRVDLLGQAVTVLRGSLAI